MKNNTLEQCAKQRVLHRNQINDLIQANVQVILFILTTSSTCEYYRRWLSFDIDVFLPAERVFAVDGSATPNNVVVVMRNNEHKLSHYFLSTKRCRSQVKSSPICAKNGSRQKTNSAGGPASMVLLPPQRMSSNLSFVCLGKVLCPISTPWGTSYMRRVFQINEGMIPYPL